MSFLHLYKFIEGRAVPANADALAGAAPGRAHVSVEDVRNAILEREYAESIEVFAVDLDQNVSLGHVIIRDTKEERYEDEGGWAASIRIDHEQNTCWARFVCCKEMMHIFDGPDEVVDTKAKFIKLLQEIEAKPPERSKALGSEYKAEWMALLILCPKPERDRYKDLFEQGQVSAYEVALHFRIPERFVMPLLGEFYDISYDALIRSEEEAPREDPNDEAPRLRA